MARYRVTYSVSYHVEAESEDDAEDKAFDLCMEEWGKQFAKFSGIDIEEDEYDEQEQS